MGSTSLNALCCLGLVSLVVLLRIGEAWRLGRLGTLLIVLAAMVQGGFLVEYGTAPTVLPAG